MKGRGAGSRAPQLQVACFLRSCATSSGYVVEYGVSFQCGWLGCGQFAAASAQDGRGVQIERGLRHFGVTRTSWQRSRDCVVLPHSGMPDL